MSHRPRPRVAKLTSNPPARTTPARAAARLRLYHLCLEPLEERAVPSSANPFYDLTTLASTAIPGAFAGQSFGNLPAINDQGRVAFVTNNPSGNGIYLAGQGQTLNVTAGFTARNDSRNYGRGVSLNDQNYIVARDQLGTQYLVREWNGNTTDQHTDLFFTPAPMLSDPDNKYSSAQTFTTINDANGHNGNGDVAFVALDEANAVRDVLFESGNELGDGTYLSAARTDGHGLSPRPQLTADDHVLYVEAGRNLYLRLGDRQLIAGAANGFSSIDPGAAVSKDGRVIVFTGNRGSGPGLFAAYHTVTDPGVPGQRGPTMGWKIVRLAGEGLDGFIGFDPSGEVAVNNTWATERGVTVAFKGTHAALGTGIYTVRISFFADNPADANPISATSTYVSGVEPVARLHDQLGGSTITDLELGQGINDVGRGQIAFWAQTANGAQQIVLADPRQVVWLNFSPPDTLPPSTTQSNLNLFKSVGITRLGWDGSMANALSFAQVKLDPTSVQNAVVATVQQIYQNAGAPVTVLGRTTDTPPAYVPEPVTSTSQLAGVYQTVYVGEGAPQGSKWLGLASQPPAAAGVVDFYDQILDDTAVVFANNILTDGAYGGTAPAALSQSQVVNGIASVVAHEAGHNFGLFHLDPQENSANPLTHEVMIDGSLQGSFDTLPEFSTTAYPVPQYDPGLANVTESSARRLTYTLGAGGDPPNPLLLRVDEKGSIRANVGFPAANPLAVKDLLVGLQPAAADTLPVFQDLGGGDLATLLNKASLAAGPLDKVIVLGSTDGVNLDIVGVAQGNEGAQNSLAKSVLGLATDGRLAAPVTGTGAALHFYRLTSSGSTDLGLAPVGASAVNHAPVLALIANQAVTFGSTVTFTASATDPDAGQTLTYSLGAGAPTGAAINPGTGAFTWTPTPAQAGQVYNFTVVATDNGTPAQAATQPVTINILNRLLAVAVTELTTPNPGPMQVAVDFNEALQAGPAQTVANYKIVSQGGVSLPIQSAAYSDSGTQHRVVLTVAPGTAVIPDVYDVSINAANLTATNGDAGAPKADQLWVDVTSENTLKPITVQPDGSFAASGDGFNLGYDVPRVLVAGNFAGNGRTDLVVATSQSPLLPWWNPSTLLLLKSNGDGTYASPVPIPLGATYEIEALNSVDWNHDGSPDLVVGVQKGPDGNAATPKYQYFVLLDDGHGNFTNAPDAPIPVTDPDPIYGNGYPFAATEVYDLNGDGSYEIAHFEEGGSNAEVIGKDPYVGYTAQMEVTPGGGVADFAFGDLNGDGKADIILREYGAYGLGGPNFSVALSTPTGYAAAQEITAIRGVENANGDSVPFQLPVGIGVGRFSGSAANDVAAVYGGVIQVYQNDGRGNFTQPDPIMLNPAYTARAVTFADLNHDGIPDVVVVEQPNQPDPNVGGSDLGNGEPVAVWTFLADGRGGFTPTSPSPITLAAADESLPGAGSGTTVGSMTLADVDGDGNLDVVLGSSFQGEVRIGINDGSGTMRPPAQPLPFLGSRNAVDAPNNGNYPGVSYKAFADFNNSGHMGFVTISPGGLDIYVGQADGAFTHSITLPTPPQLSGVGYPTWIKVGDVNNDGVPDILCGDVGPGMAVYLGNGDGTFQQAPTFIAQAGGYGFANITLADVNHDGNLDVVANVGSGYGVLFGDGKGDFSFNLNTLVPVSTSAPGQANKSAPALGDFNRDGKPDLLVPTSPDGGNTFSLTDYLGRGNGTFSPGPVIYSGASTSDTQELAGDLNGDGAPDLVTYANFALGAPGSAATAHVYLGNGDGSFRTAPDLDLTLGLTVPNGTFGTTYITLGDFNGDGRLDLAASFYSGRSWAGADKVGIYTGDGTGHFAAPQFVTVGLDPFTLVSIPRAPFLDAGSFAVTDQTPTANNDQATVRSGSSVVVPVLANDTDPDHDPLTITQVTTPAHGTAHIDPSSNAVVYAPAPGFSGTDTFTYTIADPAGAEASATVTVTAVAITITPASLPGAHLGASYSQQLTVNGGTAPYTFAVSAGKLPDGLTLSQGGLLSGTPTTDGTTSFTVTMTDAAGLSASQTYSLAVDVRPVSNVAPLPAFSAASFLVQWFGVDPMQFGPPIASYDVFVSDNGGAFTPFLTGTTKTSATFTGVNGHTYGFYSVATDTAGTREAAPAAAQATTRVDTVAPTSTVAALPATEPSPTFTVTWSGSDDPGGSGIDIYTVFVSVDGGPFDPWVTNAKQTSASYTGAPGHRYGFYSVARDNVGNNQPTPPAAQASTQVGATVPAAATRKRFVVTPDVGGGPIVNLYDSATGALVRQFAAYDPAFRGGVRAATADITGDGVEDVITGAGPGGGPHVEVFDGVTGQRVLSFFAYEPSYTGGIYVAAGDVTGDGTPDIITGTGIGGGPLVKVFDGRTGAMLSSFYAYEETFRGGVNVSIGDINGDGKAEVVTGSGVGGGPLVKYFNGLTGQLGLSFYAYEDSFRGGVNVTAGDLDGDGKAEIIAGAGVVGGPLVKVFRGTDGTLRQSYYAYDPAFRGGVRVATARRLDGGLDIVTAPGTGGGPDVRRFDGRSGANDGDAMAFDPSFLGGIFVG